MSVEIEKLENLLKKGACIDSDMAELIPIYLENVTADFQKLSISVEREDFTEIKKYTHRIKGTALSYGFEAIDLLMKDIEKSCFEENIKNIQNRLSDFEIYLKQIGSLVKEAS